MANQYQDISRQKSRRYTIPHLLQLAQRGERAFDLSKFTYDAARAGVVPPLGDCAVSLRRTSGNRPRGWSTETISTNEDVVAFQGNTVQLPHPDRQPRGPPGENKHQKEEGFARFLKKHSSPTHNRVTAGGRIVPMEKRETPPRFDLPQPGQPELWNAEPIKQELSMHPDLHAPSFHSTAQPSIVPASEAVRSPTGYILGSDLNSPPAGVSADTSTTADNGQAVFPQNGALTGTRPTCAPQAGQLSPVSGFFYPQMAVPMYPGSPGFMTFPQLSWPYSQMNFATAGGSPSPAGFDAEAQALTASQQVLYQARNEYHSLSEQLNMIDRHRATSHHDPGLSQHRLAVVERREQKRRLVQILEKKVAIEQSLASLQGAMVFTPQLNVQAPAYVPRPTDPSQERKDRPSGASNGPAPAQTPDKTQSAAKRKPIPIVPPPELLQKQTPSFKSTEALKAATAGAKQTAGEIESTEQIKQERPQPPSPEQMQPAVQHGDAKSEIGTRSLKELELDSVPDLVASHKEKSTQVGSHGEESSGGAASTRMHDLWDIELDALRLPEGTLTRLKVSDGQWLDIMGVNLQCPPGSKMTEFETKYWANKPVFTKEMLDRLQKVASIENVEELDVGKLLEGRTVSESLLNKENVFDGASVRRYKVKRYSHKQHDYTQNALQELSLQQQNISSTHGQNGDSIADSLPTTSSQDVPGSFNASLAENLSLDPMSNKGYSSVSVQNIHATIHLPPALDGAGDGRRRNAKSMLTSASKIRSPRVVHRSDGGKWLGPHFRGVRAQEQSEGNY